MLVIPALLSFSVFFFNAPPTPELYPLSLHDALPISTQTRLGPRHDPVGAVHQSNRVGCDGRRTAVAGLWRLRHLRNVRRVVPHARIEQEAVGERRLPVGRGDEIREWRVRRGFGRHLELVAAL